jgi:hypothetical protein
MVVYNGQWIEREGKEEHSKQHQGGIRNSVANTYAKLAEVWAIVHTIFDHPTNKK